MSHFAEIDQNNIVIRVVVASQDVINSGILGDPENFIQTSYNNNIRKKFAGVGFKYDEVNDIFIEPQPYPSWILNGNHEWQAPVQIPSNDKNYTWSEEMQNWTLMDPT